MDVCKSADASWSLERTSAKLRGAIEMRVDAARPDLGLRPAIEMGQTSLASLLCVKQTYEATVKRWPLELSEAYLRGDDLIASYRPTLDCPFSPQIYWRAHPLNDREGVVESVSLMVSFQTHLLDTHPQIAVSSLLESAEVVYLTSRNGRVGNVRKVAGDVVLNPTHGVDCIMFRIAGDKLSYAEFVSASDYQALRFCENGAGAPIANWELFAEFLEKGVIRKARIHAAFIRRADDLQIAADCCEAIEQSALPLTT